MITYCSCTSQEIWALIFSEWLVSVLNSSFFLFWHLTLVFPSIYVSTLFFLPFGSLLHFSRLSLIKYFTWNSISHCMGIPSKLPKGPLMGPYRDLGRIPINGELNIIWGILIICYHARIQYLITSAVVSLPLM